MDRRGDDETRAAGRGKQYRTSESRDFQEDARQETWEVKHGVGAPLPHT